MRNEGLLFSNFASPLSLDDQFSMGWVVLMLFIDTILYMTLYWLVKLYINVLLMYYVYINVLHVVPVSDNHCVFLGILMQLNQGSTELQSLSISSFSRHTGVENLLPR